MSPATPAADVLIVDYLGESYRLRPARTWMREAERALAAGKPATAMRAVLLPDEYERFRRTATVTDLVSFLAAAGVRVSADVNRNRPRDPRNLRRRRR